MWILQKIGSEEQYKLLVDKEYVVGRKDVDVILMNDQSISRKHAVMSFTSHPGQSVSSRYSRLVLRDCSKYGSFFNGERMVSDSRGRELADGDTIKFGVFDNVWIIVHRPLLCCTSCLSVDGKNSVQDLITRLAGQVVLEWTEQCSLLIMEKLTVTIKMINALVSLKRVVTPKYFEDLVEACLKQEKAPDPSAYLPLLEISEFLNDSVDFAPNDERTSMFSNTMFLSFSSKQVKKLKLVMKQANATLKFQDFSKASLDVDLVRCNVNVLQPPKNTVPIAFENKLLNFLKMHNKRLIPEAEFGLAIIYCSRSKFCNPNEGLGSETIWNTNTSSIQETQAASQNSRYDTQTSDHLSPSLFENNPSVKEGDDFDGDTMPFLSQQLVSTIPSFLQNEIESVQLGTCLQPSLPNQNGVLSVENECNITAEEEPMDVQDTEENTDPYVDNVSFNDNIPKEGISKIKMKTVQKSFDQNSKSKCDTEHTSYVVLKYTSLIRHSRNVKTTSTDDVNNSDGVRNYKIFRKVLPLGNDDGCGGVQRRPRIEMMKRVTQSQSSSEENGIHDDDNNSGSDSANIFDWPF